MPNKPKHGSKAARSADNKMPPQEKSRKALKDLADLKKQTQSMNKRSNEKLEMYKRKLKKLEYLQKATELVTHKLRFTVDLLDLRPWEGDEKPFLNDFTGKVFVAHKDGQKNGPTSWKMKKHSHRFTFRLNNPLSADMTMKIKVHLSRSSSRWDDLELRELLEVDQEMQPDDCRDEGELDDYNKCWEVYFTPTAEEIEENDNSQVFGFCLMATQLKIE
jgi:hypothetical protein